jgi:CHRD domain
MRIGTVRLGITAAAAVLAICFAAVSADAQTMTLTAQLHGGEENPAIITGSHGNATVTIDRDAQRITYRVNVYNLPTGVTASHIHVGPIGVNGPIIFNFNVTATVSNDFGYSGVVTAADLQPRPANGINSFEDAVMAIASGVTYVNVHTQANGGGEIRGQLCPESTAHNTLNAVATCIAKK